MTRHENPAVLLLLGLAPLPLTDAPAQLTIADIVEPETERELQDEDNSVPGTAVALIYSDTSWSGAVSGAEDLEVPSKDGAGDAKFTVPCKEGFATTAQGDVQKTRDRLSGGGDNPVWEAAGHRVCRQGVWSGVGVSPAPAGTGTPNAPRGAYAARGGAGQRTRIARGARRRRVPHRDGAATSPQKGRHAGRPGVVKKRAWRASIPRPVT